MKENKTGFLKEIGKLAKGMWRRTATLAAVAVTMMMTTETAWAKIYAPVKWRAEATRKGKDRAEVRLTARIDEGWHVYGCDIAKGGPVSTEFKVRNTSGGKETGSPKIEGERHTMYDETFEMTLETYENRMVYSQMFGVSDTSDFETTIEVRYMSCDSTSCLPPSVESFTVRLPSLRKDNVRQKEEKKDAAVAAETMDGNMHEGKHDGDVYYEEQKDGTWKEMSMPQYLKGDTGMRSATDGDGNGYGWEYVLMILMSGVAAGLLSILTPCVWPVIPMTVSFFLKKGGGRRDAMLYSASIFLIYLTLGMVVTVIFGADTLNSLATNAWVNVGLFALMTAFALSFMGLYEIELPSEWSTELNRRAEKSGGIVGIMLMASVLVVVSFSCTGPIIGTLLVEVAGGRSILNPLIGMTGFALAISLPFGLFAMFPSMMQKMPKSGSWMQTIKYVLAAIEMLFALKFLSVADMTKGWGILPRWLMITLWGVTGLALAAVTMREMSKRHKGASKALDITVIVLSVVFAGYMFSGLAGNKLKGVSAFMPPMEPEMEVYTDMEAGYSAAERYQKPVLIDFTGWGCVNCRKMEAAVMTDGRIEELMRKYVVIRLYVDDRKPLESRIRVRENGEEKTIETIGEKWSYVERRYWNENTQPLYIQTDSEGNMINVRYSYNEDKEKFAEWLEGGLSRQK